MTKQPGMSSQDAKQRKIALRKQIIGKRDKLPPEVRASKSAIICDKLWRLLQQQLDKLRIHNGQPATVLSYLPFRSEVDVLPFLHWCWTEGIAVAVPRTLPDERRMIFHRIGSLADTETTSPYGIREPHPGLAAVDDPSSAVMILVPGAVFDPAGRRIGYGGGYYDRYLAGLVEPARECAPDIGYAGGAHPTVPGTAERPLLVAPCFDLQVVASVPAEPHDISMDLILTEHREIVVRDRG
jgi:5-formyltetrahydrofolate cyclo-ligase